MYGKHSRLAGPGQLSARRPLATLPGVARLAYVDCFSGVSGDMLLGALLDSGLAVDELRAGLERLPVRGWALDVLAAEQHGIGGTRAHVRLDQDADQPHRGLADVEAVVAAGGLPETVRDRALAVFRRLATVEARIHGTTVDEVHFHEVGAVDAIVDVVGVVLGLHLLGVDAVLSSGLPTGSGWVRSSHGPLPVPAPATLELMRLAQAPTRRTPPTSGDTGELTTPTGAALLTTLGRFEQPTFVQVQRVGYGFGSRELPWPNAVRLCLGEVAGSAEVERDWVTQLETNLDDATPEELGFAMERLLEAGALDVAFSPLQMKKNRPGVLLRVLARPADATRLAEMVLEQTSAFGVRLESLERVVAPRSQVEVETPWGRVRVKRKLVRGRLVSAPEYEDCARLARDAGLPLRRVFEAALVVAGDGGG